MKKLILFFALLAFCMNAKAQHYVPFPDSNACWNEVFTDVDSPNYYYTYYIKGDTVIDSLSFHKLYSIDDTRDIKYLGGYRESNKKIYYLDGGCSDDMLLYNFNFTTGDSINISCSFCDTTTPYTFIKVISVDSVLIEDMTYRKRINFSYGISWIEGIGSVTGLLYPELMCPACMCNIYLVCFRQNDSTLYFDSSDTCFSYVTSINELKSNNDLITIFPNPAFSEILVIGNQSTVSGIEIYNMLGEKVYQSLVTGHYSPVTIDVSALQAGMYFMEVKSEKGVTVKKFIKE
jgi:hypothetical protein